MTAAVPRMGKGGKVVLFVVMVVVVVVVVVVIVVVVKVERRMGSRQVESSGRSGSRGSFLQLGVVINGDLNFVCVCLFVFVLKQQQKEIKQLPVKRQKREPHYQVVEIFKKIKKFRAAHLFYW